MAQPVNKWIQSIFWPISVLPSFGHIPKHSTGDYVGRTSPLLGTAFAFWIAVIGAVVVFLISRGVIDVDWRGSTVDTVLNVMLLFVLVLYIAGFWMFLSREEEYPN